MVVLGFFVLSLWFCLFCQRRQLCSIIQTRIRRKMTRSSWRSDFVRFKRLIAFSVIPTRKRGMMSIEKTFWEGSIELRKMETLTKSTRIRFLIYGRFSARPAILGLVMMKIVSIRCMSECSRRYGRASHKSGVKNKAIARLARLTVLGRRWRRFMCSGAILWATKTFPGRTNGGSQMGSLEMCGGWWRKTTTNWGSRRRKSGKKRWGSSCLM